MTAFRVKWSTYYCTVLWTEKDREVAVPHLLSSSWGIWFGQIQRHIPPLENSLLIFDIHCFHRRNLSFRLCQYTCWYALPPHQPLRIPQLPLEIAVYTAQTHPPGPQYVSLKSSALLTLDLVREASKSQGTGAL